MLAATDASCVVSVARHMGQVRLRVYFRALVALAQQVRVCQRLDSGDHHLQEQQPHPLVLYATAGWKVC